MHVVSNIYQVTINEYNMIDWLLGLLESHILCRIIKGHRYSNLFNLITNDHYIGEIFKDDLDPGYYIYYIVLESSESGIISFVKHFINVHNHEKRLLNNLIKFFNYLPTYIVEIIYERDRT